MPTLHSPRLPLVNIHSHLGGAVLFVALLFTFPIGLLRPLRVDYMGRYDGVRDLFVLRYFLPLLERVLPHV